MADDAEGNPYHRAGPAPRVSLPAAGFKRCRSAGQAQLSHGQCRRYCGKFIAAQNSSRASTKCAATFLMMLNWCGQSAVCRFGFALSPCWDFVWRLTPVSELELPFRSSLQRWCVCSSSGTPLAVSQL